MFKCKSCPEKDKRIIDLKGEIAYLRTMFIAENSQENIPHTEGEADSAISGAEESVKQEDEEALEKAEALIREKDLLLSGNYE